VNRDWALYSRALVLEMAVERLLEPAAAPLTAEDVRLLEQTGALAKRLVEQCEGRR
jgi:hypothetical protein